MLGGVVEVDSSNPAVGHKCFSAFTGTVDFHIKQKLYTYAIFAEVFTYPLR